jgi:hypothetical protein
MRIPFQAWGNYNRPNRKNITFALSFAVGRANPKFNLAAGFSTLN